ncbi:11880_t:CDS:1, partial [Racocetra fulgida]
DKGEIAAYAILGFIGLTFITVFMSGLIKSCKKGIAPQFLLYFILAFVCPPLSVKLLKDEIEDLKEQRRILEKQNGRKDESPWYKEIITCF